MRHNHTNPTMDEAFPADFRADPKGFGVAAGNKLRALMEPVRAVVSIPISATYEKRIAALMQQIAVLGKSGERAQLLLASKEKQIVAQVLEIEGMKGSVITANHNASADRRKAADLALQLKQMKLEWDKDRAGYGSSAGDKLLQDCAEQYGITVAQIMGSNVSTTQGPMMFARQHAMYRLRKELRWSFPAIGKFLNRDHSTIIHGVRCHERRMSLTVEKPKPAPIFIRPSDQLRDNDPRSMSGRILTISKVGVHNVLARGRGRKSPKISTYRISRKTIYADGKLRRVGFDLLAVGDRAAQTEGAPPG